MLRQQYPELGGEIVSVFFDHSYLAPEFIGHNIGVVHEVLDSCVVGPDVYSPVRWAGRIGVIPGRLLINIGIFVYVFGIKSFFIAAIFRPAAVWINIQITSSLGHCAQSRAVVGVPVSIAVIVR